MRVSCKSLNPTTSDSPICDHSCMTFACLNGPQPTRGAASRPPARISADQNSGRGAPPRCPPAHHVGDASPPRPSVRDPGFRLATARISSIAAAMHAPQIPPRSSRNRAAERSGRHPAGREAPSRSEFCCMPLAGWAGGAWDGLSRTTDHSSDIAARPLGASMAAGIWPVVPDAGSLLERQIFRSGFCMRCSDGSEESHS